MALAVGGIWELAPKRHPLCFDRMCKFAYPEDIIEEYMNGKFHKSLGWNITYE